MKRAAALGVMALTIAVNMAPIKVEAAGLNTCQQYLNGTNAITISESCNLEELTSKLQNLQINGNCTNLGGITEIVKSATDSSQKECNTGTKAKSTENCETTQNCEITQNSTPTQNCYKKVTENLTSTEETSTEETTTEETSTEETSTEETSTEETTTEETTTEETSTEETTTEEISTEETSTEQTTTKETSTKETTTEEVNTKDNNTLSYAEQVVRLVNVERAKEGLSALAIDKNVEKAALVRANEIQSSFSHTRPNGSSFATSLKENGVSYSGAGENIAWGQKTPEQVVEAWMNSASHRANIMNKNYKYIGVGNLQNTAGTQYWVQLFTF